MESIREDIFELVAKDFSADDATQGQHTNSDPAFVLLTWLMTFVALLQKKHYIPDSGVSGKRWKLKTEKLKN